MEISEFDLMRLFTLVEYQLGEKNKKKKKGGERERGKKKVCPGRPSYQNENWQLR